MTLWYFSKKSKNVRIHKIRLEKKLMLEIVSVGFSAMLMQVMTLVQQTVLYNVASRYGGESWQILLGASLRIQAFAFIPLWGVSQGFQPAAGTNYGAGEYGRVKQVTSVFVLGATALALVFYLPIQLFPRQVLSLFITEPDIVAMGASDFRILFSSYILMGFLICAISLFQAIGKASKASVLVMLRQVVLFIPMAVLLPRISSLGIHGVWIAPAAVDLTVFALSVGFVTAQMRGLSKKQWATRSQSAA